MDAPRADRAIPWIRGSNGGTDARAAMDPGAGEQDAAPAVRYAIITPVRNEAEHVGATIASVVSQTLRPTCWIVVDDGSSDGTSEILDRQAADLPWMKVIHRCDRGRRSAGGGVMEAFYAGYPLLDCRWDYLVKLDADLSFDASYFARCFAEFARDPRLGIGGGTVCRMRGSRAEVEAPGDPRFHVRGATKIYRRECWSAIEPLIIAPGWDTVDEVKANMLGWTTRTFDHIQLIQNKPTGAADGSWRDSYKNGRANFICGYHPLFMLVKCIRRVVAKPVLLQSAALLAGYCSGYARRASVMQDERVKQYLRREQIRRLMFKPSLYD